jgi:hypothetical protein
MHFGHTDSMDKRVSPRFEMVFLGVTIALLSEVMFLSEEKAKSFRAAVLDCVRSLRQPNGSVLVAPSALSSMMHKLLHAATVVPLGRQHLFHVMRSSKASAHSAGGMKPLGVKVLQELEWLAELQQANAVAGVPLASRMAMAGIATTTAIMARGALSPALETLQLLAPRRQLSASRLREISDVPCGHLYLVPLSGFEESEGSVPAVSCIECREIGLRLNQVILCVGDPGGYVGTEIHVDV